MFERPNVPHIPENVSYKWSQGVLDEGFVPFPKRLLRCLSSCFYGENGVEELRVVLSVVDYRRPKQPHPPSIDYLAFTAGMEADRFWTVLHELQQKSMLKITGTQAHVDVDLSPLLKKISEQTSDHPAAGS